MLFLKRITYLDSDLNRRSSNYLTEQLKRAHEKGDISMSLSSFTGHVTGTLD